VNTHRRATGRSWRRTTAGIAALCVAIVVAGGCGGSDAPAVCGSLEELSADVDALQDIDFEAGESSGTVAEIEESLEAIGTDLENVKTEAEAELSEPIAGLESTLDALSTEFDTARADDDLSAAEAQSLLDSLAAVSTSWEAVTAAAPECDL
jgi:chromosome segregation ATPase